MCKVYPPEFEVRSLYTSWLLVDEWRYKTHASPWSLGVLSPGAPIAKKVPSFFDRDTEYPKLVDGVWEDEYNKVAAFRSIVVVVGLDHIFTACGSDLYA